MKLITIQNIDGRNVHLPAESISRVIETGPGSQWYGIRSIVKLFDSSVIECRQNADEVARLIVEARNSSIEGFRDRCIDVVAFHGGSVEIEAAIRALPV